LHSKPIHPDHAHRPDEHFLNRLDHLRNWRKYSAQKMGVQSDVVLPRNLMQLLALKNPQDIDELSTLLSDVPWRFQHFGVQILEVLSKS
jgi:ribonuclease D